MAISFFASQARYIYTNSPPDFLKDPAGESFTIEFWLLPANYYALSNLVDSASGGTTKGFIFEASYNPSKQTVSVSGYAFQEDYPNSYFHEMPLEDWEDLITNPIHVATTVAGGQVSAIYLNGIRRFKNVTSTTTARTNNGNRLKLGANLHQHALQEFRVWSHARTQQQIEDNMYCHVAPNSSGLVLYWKLDETEGTTAYDSSPSGRDGAVYNSAYTEWIDNFVDLGSRIVRGSITFHGHASASFGTPIKKAVGSITFRGHASMIASAVKTAVGSITFHGTSTMTLVGLVLRELEGIYQISSSEIFSRTQPILPTDLANHIEVWINPLVPADETIELYRSKEAEEIPAGGSRTFNVDYDSKPVIEAIASLEEAGLNLSITDTKYYSSTAKITVTNAGASAESCIVVIEGKPLELQGRRKIIMEDPESVLDHGRVKYKFDSPLVQDERSARIIGAEVLRMFAVARANIEIEWRGDPALELADPVQIPEFERRGVSKKENFYIVKQELEGDGGLRAVMSGRKIPEIDPLRINPWTDILFPFRGSLESSDGRYKPIGMSEGGGEGGEGMSGGMDGEGGEIEEEIIETPPDEPDEPDDGKAGAGEGEVDALWR